MTKTDITAMPSTTRRIVAGLGRLGDIGAEAVRPSSLVSPQLATSATMLAFHEPPEAVSAPVT